MTTRGEDGKIRETEIFLRNMTESIQCAQREGNPRERSYFNDPEEEPEVDNYKVGKLFGRFKIKIFFLTSYRYAGNKHDSLVISTPEIRNFT